MNTQENKTATASQKNFYDCNYWRTEGRALLELRRLMSFLTAIAIEDMPSPFVSTKGEVSFEEGWYVEWGTVSGEQLTIETEKGSFCVYASTKDFGFEFWYDFICPNEDGPTDRDPQTVDITVDLLDEAIAAAKNWLVEHRENLNQESRDGMNSNRKGMLMEFGLI